jgi:hypothetical protein
MHRASDLCSMIMHIVIAIRCCLSIVADAGTRQRLSGDPNTASQFGKTGHFNLAMRG